MSETRQIFKIAVLSHDENFYEELKEREEIFGIEFTKSYTQTKGAAFAYTHFSIEDQRLTGQFWMLDANPQWISVRSLYMRGASGIIVLIDPEKRGAIEQTQRLIREYVSINRFPIPIIVVGFSQKKTPSKKLIRNFAEDIERWSGIPVPSLSSNDSKTLIQDDLKIFMRKVRDWRAKNVIFQTLKLYFSLDAIQNTERSINKIATQLRQIYTSRYYELIDDVNLTHIIREAAYFEGFSVNIENETVIYQKKLQEEPWMPINQNDESLDSISKPKVEKIE
ncbi:MAG: hypothetical protein ACXAD7_03800 [Candidatus Kariarchaeaceae archaeon]|jgi:hypothetical protein